MKFKFSTKSQTLKNLEKFIQTVEFAPTVIFSCSEWKHAKKNVIQKIKLLDFPIIIRSSALSEDTEEFSNAGAYLSLGNIGKKEIESSVFKVIESYGPWNGAHEVLVQPMIKQVAYSGVIFSHDPKSGSPYKVINWSEGSDTAVVTAGSNSRVYYHAPDKRNELPNNLKTLGPMMDELDQFLDEQPYDLEFVVSRDQEKPWLVQLRPLILKNKPIKKEILCNTLTKISKNLKLSMQKHPYVFGKKTMFGSMPDWNPAEIIGTNPRPLSLSLYRELITDNIWAYQRSNYGYKNLRSFPLLKSFYGIPMVDVRVSFNSFIPNDLDDRLTEKLANFYLDYLEKNPFLHDKVEFDIVFSCYSLDHYDRCKVLLDWGFTSKEVKTLSVSLINLTNKIINFKSGLWTVDTEKIDVLSARRKKLLGSGLSNLDTIYWLLEDTKRYGTLPFAGLARAGFIGVQLLNSLVATNTISVSEHQSFLSSLSTISNNLKHDITNISKADFIAKYGHLRPGTYDILSARYDENFENYFNINNSQKIPALNPQFELSEKARIKLEKLLGDTGLEISCLDFLKFIKIAIEQREKSKFEFTKNLSEILKRLKLLGEQMGFSKEEMSYFDISVLRNNYPCEIPLKKLISDSIDFGKSIYDISQMIKLPPLITSPKDVWGYELMESIPNFITTNKISGSITTSLDPSKIRNKIVAIPNADPGYDWLFSHKIRGFITAWGGPNSHMAIRAGELNIPAIVGCGELLYERWINSSSVEINCEIGKVTVIE